MIEFQPGDIVRVSKPDDFSVSFAKKVRDRDAVVIRAFVPLGSNATTVAIRFLKRNGRGSEFEEFMRAAHVYKVVIRGFPWDFCLAVSLKGSWRLLGPETQDDAGS